MDFILLNRCPLDFLVGGGIDDASFASGNASTLVERYMARAIQLMGLIKRRDGGPMFSIAYRHRRGGITSIRCIGEIAPNGFRENECTKLGL
jgi:hypothetical protein